VRVSEVDLARLPAKADQLVGGEPGATDLVDPVRHRHVRGLTSGYVVSDFSRCDDDDVGNGRRLSAGRAACRSSRGTAGTTARRALEAALSLLGELGLAEFGEFVVDRWVHLRPPWIGMSGQHHRPPERADAQHHLMRKGSDRQGPRAAVYYRPMPVALRPRRHRIPVVLVCVAADLADARPQPARSAARRIGR